MLNQTNNITINNCDDDLLENSPMADEYALQFQAIAEIFEQTTYAKAMTSKTINHLVSSGSAKKSKLKKNWRY